jgi:hypothetical protein
MTQIDGSQDEGAVQNIRTLSSLLHRREMLCRGLYDSHKTH